jgi:hypothetical protein
MIPGDLIHVAHLNHEPFLSETVDGGVFVWVKKIDAGRDDAEVTSQQVEYLKQKHGAPALWAK